MSRQVSPLHETESERLQKEIDTFTHKLEQQRRRNASLDSQVQTLAQEVEDKKEEIRKTLPSVKEELQVERKVKHLENTLHNEAVRLNQIDTQNKELRQKITRLRKNKKTYIETLEKLEQDKALLMKKAEEVHSTQIEGTNVEEDFRLKIFQLRDEAQKELSHIHSRYSKIYNEIEEERKTQKHNKLDIGAIIMDQDSQKNAVDPHKVLETLCEKWVKACRSRKKEVDEYSSSIASANYAYNQIRTATNAEEVDEMVVAFSKSEDQHYTLHSYVNSLNTELDALEERHTALQEQYNTLQTLLDQERKKNASTANRLNENLTFLKQEHKNLLEELAYSRKEFEEIQEPAEALLREFEHYNFPLQFNKKLTREKGFTVSEQNIEQYLGELEEYFNTIFAFIVHKRGENPLSTPPSPTKPLEKPHYLTQFLNSEHLIDGLSSSEPLSYSDFKRLSESFFYTTEAN